MIAQQKLPLERPQEPEPKSRFAELPAPVIQNDKTLALITERDHLEQQFGRILVLKRLKSTASFCAGLSRLPVV